MGIQIGPHLKSSKPPLHSVSLENAGTLGQTSHTQTVAIELDLELGAFHSWGQHFQQVSWTSWSVLWLKILPWVSFIRVIYTYNLLSYFFFSEFLYCSSGRAGSCRGPCSQDPHETVVILWLTILLSTRSCFPISYHTLVRVRASARSKKYSWACVCITV